MTADRTHFASFSASSAGPVGSSIAASRARPGQGEGEAGCEELWDSLAQRRLLILSGKGGVGRSTAALLLAIAVAQRHKRVLLATTGHDDRLAWMCGLSRLTLEAQTVAACPGLSMLRLEPPRCVREYGELMLKSRTIARALFENRLVKGLLGAIPGLDDFAVLGKVWHEAVREGRYDCVVFDGPASGHLRLTLGVPQTLIDTVPGGPLVREAQAMQQSLSDFQQSAAVLVALAQPWPLTEMAEMAVDLESRIRLRSAALMINQLWPPAAAHFDPAAGRELLALGAKASRGSPGQGLDSPESGGGGTRGDFGRALGVVGRGLQAAKVQRDELAAWQASLTHPLFQELPLLGIPRRSASIASVAEAMDLQNAVYRLPSGSETPA